MTILDIILLLIGILLIIISCIISVKSTDSTNTSNSVHEVWSEKEEETIKKHIEQLLSDKSREIVYGTEEDLCHISNEKIIEFKDYSDQVLAKIDENHRQAVFLYNMLNEKQNEMKNWITRLDMKHADIENSINYKMKSNGLDSDNHEKTEDKVNNSNILRKTYNNSSNKSNANIKELVISENDKADNTNVSTNGQLDIDPISYIEQDYHADNEETDEKFNLSNWEERVVEQAGEVRNKKILSLKKEGKSILEISKQLGIGQGEVKLVIDLYKGE